MKLNVLFIGNSHTYLHYMPQMLVALVKSADRGYGLKVDQCTGEGVSLEWHWNNDPTREKIQSKAWDFVVLQDRSGGPLEDLKSFQSHARLLDQEIKKQGGKTIFFMTWANRSRPLTQATLADAYDHMAKELGAILAPVGLAWETALNRVPGLNLHHEDGRHANSTGAYLSACLFYVLLFKSSPEGLPAAIFIQGKKWVDLDKSTALLLQRTAFETVMNTGF